MEPGVGPEFLVRSWCIKEYVINSERVTSNALTAMETGDTSEGSTVGPVLRSIDEISQLDEESGP